MLIKFERVHYLVFGGTLLLFAILVSLGIHGSSLPCWNHYVFDRPGQATGLLLGNPREIRSDEWKVQAAWMLAQAEHKPPFPVINSNIGLGQNMLMAEVPVRHFITLFRPFYWGFFFLDNGRGLAWWWWSRAIGMILSLFLLLLLLLKNDSALSLFGAFWIFFSSAMQWWFSRPCVDLAVYLSLVFVSLMHALYASKMRAAVIWSVLFCWSLVGFFSVPYPPMLISYGYLLIFLIVGFIAARDSHPAAQPLRPGSILLIAIASVVSLAILGLYLRDIWDVLMTIRETVYPGKRMARGGGVNCLQFVSESFAPLFSQDHHPRWMGNICEGSSFLFLFPFAGLLLLAQAFRRKFDAVAWIPLLYVLFLAAWATIRFPVAFGKATLFAYVGTHRIIWALGIASIIVTLRALKMSGAAENTSRLPGRIGGLVAVAWGVFLIGCGIYSNTLDKNLISPSMLVLFSITGGLIVGCYLSGRKNAFIAITGTLVFVSSFWVNPISIGAGPVYDKELSRRIVALNRQEHAPKRWAVFGDNTLGNLLVALGVNSVNAVHQIPQLKLWEQWDPKGVAWRVYNRYAHVDFEAREGSEIAFEAVPPDVFRVFLDPRSPRLKDLNVGFILSRGSLASYPGLVEQYRSETQNVYIYSYQ